MVGLGDPDAPRNQGCSCKVRAGKGLICRPLDDSDGETEAQEGERYPPRPSSVPNALSKVFMEPHCLWLRLSERWLYYDKKVEGGHAHLNILDPIHSLGNAVSFPMCSASWS